MSDAATPPTSKKHLWVLAICGTLLAISAALGYREAIRESPTCDEPLHAAAGYFIRWQGDYRIDIEDPALFPLISSLPNRSADLHFEAGDPILASVLADHSQQSTVAVKLLFRTPPASDAASTGIVYSGPEYINRSRMIFTAINFLLGALITWWAYQIAGSWGAMIACGLFAFDPNFLAHGSLVKNDVPITFLMLWLAYAIWRFGQRGTSLNLASIAMACALAVNVKFSSPMFGAILACSLLVRAISPVPWPMLGRELVSRPARISAALGVCVLTACVCWVAIWSVYGWRFSIAPDPAVKFDPAPFIRDAKTRELATVAGNVLSDAQIDAQPISRPVRLILWLDKKHFLPDAWLFGLLYTYTTSLARDSFLMGEHSITGWWYYFPLAMAFKTPMATLMAMIVLLARILRRMRRSTNAIAVDHSARWTRICLCLPIVLYGLAAMTTNLNLGLRHILPIYPFVYLLIAVGLARWLAEKSRAVAAYACIVVVGAAIESLACWPHQIAFFNFACGGPRGGIDLLGDSNLDWGQDLPLLAKWQQEHSDRPLYLAYFGTTDPAWYGIRYLHVSGGYDVYSDQPVVPLGAPGVFAISATYLQGIYWSESARQNLVYLRQRKPLTVLGNSIYLYEWDPIEFGAWRAANQITRWDRFEPT